MNSLEKSLYYSFLINIYKNNLKQNIMTTNLFSRISTIWTDLLEAKRQEDKKQFDKLMLSVIPELEHYIRRRLKVSIKKGKLPKNKYKATDFLNRIYLDAYENISNFSDVQSFVNWLFAKADDLLEETISDEEFKLTFFENFDTYSKKEWEAMEEEFSVDGDGDLMMLEEFDDPSYKTSSFPNFEYTLDDVFVDKEEPKKIIDEAHKGFIKELRKKLTPQEINNHIKMVVEQLPVDERGIFELSVLHNIDNHSIAKIKKIDITEVDKKLNIIKRRIIKTFVKRHNL